MTKLFSICNICHHWAFLPIKLLGSNNQKIYLCRTCVENFLKVIGEDRFTLARDLQIVWKWLENLYTERSNQWSGPRMFKG